MPNDDERYATLQWAATFRGASTLDEAHDWMETAGYIGALGLTDEGRERADEIYATLERVGAAHERRHRTNMVLFGLGALLAWKGLRR
jgi:hypothetical protein